MRIERHDEIALLRLNAGKANAMTADFLTGLGRLVDEATAPAAGVRALVLTGERVTFSAGLALPSLLGLERAALRGFMDLFARTMLRVFTCELPVVAAVNGHAIAGGCVLALECDARLMADGAGKIGLTEVTLGIGLPAVVIEPLRLVVPARALAPIALEGRLFDARAALELGLVDELVVPAELETRAIARARELARAAGPAFAQVKQALRRPALDAIARHGADERERWLDTWYSPAAQARLAEQVARLAAPRPDR